MVDPQTQAVSTAPSQKDGSNPCRCFQCFRASFSGYGRFMKYSETHQQQGERQLKKSPRSWSSPTLDQKSFFASPATGFHNDSARSPPGAHPTTLPQPGASPPSLSTSFLLILGLCIFVKESNQQMRSKRSKQVKLTMRISFFILPIQALKLGVMNHPSACQGH